MTDLGARNPASRILTADSLSEVSQYKFYMEKMTVYHKHVTLKNNKNEGKGISGMKSIDNPFKVNLLPMKDIREITSLASGQAILKAIKSSLK